MPVDLEPEKAGLGGTAQGAASAPWQDQGATASRPPPPVRSRTRLATLNVLAGQLSTVLTMFVGLVCTPLLLRWLGPQRFGLLRVLDVWTNYLGYLGIPGFCVLAASSFAMVPLLARHDSARLNHCLGATGFSLLLLAALNLGLGLGLVGALPYLAPAPAGLNNERWWAFVLGLFVFWLLPGQMVFKLFEADQRAYRVTLILAAQSLCMTGLALAAAWLGWGLPGQMIATLLASAFQVVLVLALARRYYPWFAPWRTTRAALRALWLGAVGFLALGALAIIVGRLEPICVNYASGPSGLTNYLLTQRLFIIGGTQAAAMSSAVWAPLTDLFHRGAHDRFRRQVCDCQQLICAVGYAGALALLGYDGHFVRLWVGAAHYDGDLLVLAFTLGLPLAAMQSFHGWLVMATGHTRQYLPGYACYAGLTVASCGLMAWRFGAVGVAWGSLATMAGLVLGWNLPTMHRTLQQPWRDLLRPYLSTTLLALPVGLTVWWFARTHTPWGWAGLAAEMAGAAFLYLALWWCLILTSGDRSGWMERARVILRRSPAH